MKSSSLSFCTRWVVRVLCAASCAVSHSIRLHRTRACSRSQQGETFSISAAVNILSLFINSHFVNPFSLISVKLIPFWLYGCAAAMRINKPFRLSFFSLCVLLGIIYIYIWVCVVTTDVRQIYKMWIEGFREIVPRTCASNSHRDF